MYTYKTQMIKCKRILPKSFLSLIDLLCRSNGYQNDQPEENSRARSSRHHEPPDDEAYSKSFDDVTYGDLRPDDFDNNHPDTIEFSMPSHEELEKNYKTVSTSASELVEHVVHLNPKKLVKIPIRNRKRRVKNFYDKL